MVNNLLIYPLLVCMMITNNTAHSESFVWTQENYSHNVILELDEYSSDPLAKALNERKEKEKRLIGEFVKIPQGSYRMGNIFKTKTRQNDNWPVHTVHINGFYLGKYEVTQAQWNELMTDAPVSAKCSTCPVVVYLKQAQEYLRRLNLNTGKQFRLPTESEWEYACRSGGKWERYCGGNNIDELGWYRENGNKKIHPVGLKKANAYGLYDMTGNVAEWVQDCYNSNYKGAPKDGSAWLEGSCHIRMLRGGSWYSAAVSAGSTHRTLDMQRHPDATGFRLAYDE
ncbi:MAG: formylglycine-generating enzyme family protein [Candidatus Thiodiazotropha taylori]|nr:formylglycine-generating enzyme family protein [Candidatus Thiodiazotropha taylori]